MIPVGQEVGDRRGKPFCRGATKAKKKERNISSLFTGSVAFLALSWGGTFPDRAKQPNETRTRHHNDAFKPPLLECGIAGMDTTMLRPHKGWNS